jgi:hypothetical protein
VHTAPSHPRLPSMRTPLNDEESGAGEEEEDDDDDDDDVTAVAAAHADTGVPAEGTEIEVDDELAATEDMELEESERAGKAARRRPSGQ